MNEFVKLLNGLELSKIYTEN